MRGLDTRRHFLHPRTGIGEVLAPAVAAVGLVDACQERRNHLPQFRQHQVGRRAGLSGDRLEQCLSDRDFAKELLATYQKNMEADEIQSTPTFLVNGEKHTGAMSFEDFSAVLDAAL